MKANVHIIEDEEDILNLLRYTLIQEGYNVSGSFSGEKGLERIRNSSLDPIDITLLDLMLPSMSGMDVCRQLKNDSSTAHIPIIMVTAKGNEENIIAGLEMGADDYITKPFSLRLLVARVKTLLRRSEGTKKQPSSGWEEREEIKIHGLYIHVGKHEVSIHGKALPLSVTEFRLLTYLATHPGWVFTRNQIVQGVQGPNYPVTDRSVDVQIVGLRKKLGKHGDWVETIRGIGYRFKE